MKSLNRWVARHRILSFVLFSTFTIIVYSALFYLIHIPTFIIIIFDLFLIFLYYSFVDSAPNALLKEPLKYYSEYCEPYPLLLETEELLTYKCSGKNRQMILIDQSAALRDLGEYQRAFDILTSINIDKYAGMLPVIKIVYYNNLADVCTFLNKYEQADIWYSKMIQLYSDMKENKAKKMFEPSIKSATAYKLYREEKYEEAIELAGSIMPTSISLEVDSALLCAKAYLKLDKKEQAIEKLRLVIQKGNKFYAVTEAQNLLKEIRE